MPDQNTPDPQVLSVLYAEYLNRSIQLTEENARLRVRVAELEEAVSETVQGGADDAA